jgi:hypothetical protein
MSFLFQTVNVYGQFVIANFLSNQALHPTQKLDYGFLNKYIGRPESPNQWWGTKTEHILTIAAPLAIADVALARGLGSKLKAAGFSGMTFKGTPQWAVFHGVAFAGLGVFGYVAYHTFFDPTIKDRKKYFLDHISPVVSGVATMCCIPKIIDKFADWGLTTRLPGPLPWFMKCIPAAIAFPTVKGFGFDDWGNRTLTKFEKELNNVE